MTRPQRLFRKFLLKDAWQFRDPPSDGKPCYLSGDDHTPFPSNPEFRSQPVLSEKARELIWDNVKVQGLPLKAVSARYKVDMRRVAAVIRMMEIEKRWEASDTEMAKPYARAVMRMLPKSDLDATQGAFEPINDIYVSGATQQQLFVPTSESRHFTRADAAKAFGDYVLPPEGRMRIPELLKFEKDVANGADLTEARNKFLQAATRSEQASARRLKAKESAKESRIQRVKSQRFEFRFEDVSVDWSGTHGRHRRGVGWRYGAPFDDRRRGAVKIPTKVE